MFESLSTGSLLTTGTHHWHCTGEAQHSSDVNNRQNTAPTSLPVPASHTPKQAISDLTQARLSALSVLSALSALFGLSRSPAVALH